MPAKCGVSDDRSIVMAAVFDFSRQLFCKTSAMWWSHTNCFGSIATDRADIRVSTPARYGMPTTPRLHDFQRYVIVLPTLNG